MDVFFKLLEDPQVVAYFVVLGSSLGYCFRYAHKTWQVIFSLGAMSVTWFYIVRWMVAYKLAGGNNLFDDAYVDVLQAPHGAVSVQLLTWVAVATVWMQEANICYMLFGMLGAMSSAFVTWVPNKPTISRGIPWFFLPASTASLFAIEMLTLTLDSPEDFGFWLKALHILLVTPQIAVLVLPQVLQVPIDGCWLYGALGVTIASRHLNKGLAATVSSYAVPESDCQLSITCDLVLCSLITLYAIYQAGASSSPSQHQSLVPVAVATVGMLVISPGAVLAFWLCLQLAGDVHRHAVGWLQSALALYLQRQGGTSHGDKDGAQRPWVNLGMGWGDAGRGYEDACVNMAATLGGAVMRPGDGVLACGCGFGAELLLWKDKFKLRHITGVDVSAQAAEGFPLVRDVRLLNIPVEDIRPRFENRVRFSTVVALDSIYHYANKTKFFSDAAALLPAAGGGRLAVTDIIRRDARASLPIWLYFTLQLMHVNASAVWSAEEYTVELQRGGWVNIRVETMGRSRVLDNWFPQCITRHLDYCMITAECPPSSSAAAHPLPKVAVIGSGLAGLTTAHLLAGTHDVTVLEANARGGLSGLGEKVHNQIVDIPLRIIGTGYYTYVERLADSLDIPVAPIRGDYLSQLNYGNSSPEGPDASFVYSQSTWFNFWACLPYVRDMFHFHRAVYEDPGAVSEDQGRGGESWGHWMHRHGYDCRRYASDSTGAQLPAGGSDSFMMWMLMGQVSWMLSCNYDQILSYPSSVILGFIRALGWGRSIHDALYSSSSKTGRMMRIQPSMQALEYALTYGIEVRCNKRVGNVGADKCIDGETYDFIVIATEASSVRRILSPELYSPIFSGVVYQPSTIYLHTDSSLMPTKKSEWNTFNMCQDKGQDMCMLTAWLNHYYPGSDFPYDIFQTWNPYVLPAEDKIIKRCDFLRVVHTGATAQMLVDIDEQQGKDGIYYAGAYSVEGMGLLEQAAKSGHKVANLIKKLSC